MQGHIHRRESVDRSGKPKVLWYVVVDIGRSPEGKRRQKWHGSFSTRREAETVRAEIVGQLHRGTYTVQSAMTLGEWVEEWLPIMRTQVKPSTFDSYQRNLRLHLVPRLGHRRLGDLHPMLLNGVYADMLATGRRNGPGGLSAKTVRYLHTTLHKVLADAMDAGLMAQNPAERAKPPRPEKMGAAPLRFWTPDQLRVFLASVVGDRLEAAWQLSAMTGMRRGEILGIRWGDIDLEAGSLVVCHTIISVAYEVLESTPKTHRSRVVDLDPGTVAHLVTHRDRQVLEKGEWGRDYQDRDLVFCREDGSPLHPDGFTQAFERAETKAGLPRIRLHDLRHTHATIALRAGVPIKVISERLGHESPAFTMKQYAHVLPGMQAEAAAQIAELVRGA